MLVALGVFALALMGAAAMAGAVLAVSRGTPPLATLQARPQSQDTVLYDSSGAVIARLHGVINRVIVPSAAIPETMKDATVAIEDRRFYEHHGVDFIAVARAAITDLLSGHIVQGASTITEQYVKNAYLGRESGFLRKIREGVLAWELEDSWSKDRILTAYLNTVYYGDGAYGVQAAAQTYFHENVSQLTLAQSALLAGLPQDPAGYSPVYDPADALARRNLVLAAMRSQGYISAAQEAAALRLKVTVFASPPPSQNGPAEYFVQYVIDQLIKRYGVSEALDGGLKVYTTLDRRMQHDALAAMKETLPAGPAGALVSIDPATGFIRAMTTTLDWTTTKFDLAWQAQRQLGSAMKPFALAAAVEEGANPATTYYTSQPLSIPLPFGQIWNVSTFSNTYAGTINLVQATWQSDNTVYAQLALDLGPQKIVAVAHAMGITSHLAPYPSIVLGTEVVNPLEVADAYATFAAEGIHHAPQAIASVVFPDGRVSRARVIGKRVLPAGVAYVVDQILAGNTRYGTAAAMPELLHRHRRRQDGHDRELGRRLVLRLRPQAGHRGLDGLPAGRDPHARRAGRHLLRAHLGPLLRDGVRLAGHRRLRAAGQAAGLHAVEGRSRGRRSGRAHAKPLTESVARRQLGAAPPRPSAAPTPTPRPTPTPTGTPTVAPSP